MYFHDRREAGKMLAESLADQYRYEDTAILAVSPGGVVVASEIAKVVHARINLLLTESITMPGVAKSEAIGLIDHEGHFTYNNMMPTGLLMEMVADMHNYIESEKMLKLHKLTRAMNEEGMIDPHQFYGHHVIVVSDGFKSGLPFDAAYSYLKTINTKDIIAVAPIVSVKAVDHLHVTADRIHVLDVLSNYLDTDHYYEDNEIPDIKAIMDKAIYEWS